MTPIMLATLIHVGATGYLFLFGLVMAESGGAPVPGETALITAAVLASQGGLEIELVIPVAAAAAIVGDNLGYQIGRRGGRWLLQRPGPFHRQRLRVISSGEPFFERHGPKAVFFGRFLLGLRVWASWLAGATHMRWRSFVFWNAAGGICWATAIGLLAYFVGDAAGNAIKTFGLFGLVAVLIVVVGGVIAHFRHRHEEEEEEEEEGNESVESGSDAAFERRGGPEETPRDDTGGGCAAPPRGRSSRA